MADQDGGIADSHTGTKGFGTEMAGGSSRHGSFTLRSKGFYLVINRIQHVTVTVSIPTLPAVVFVAV